MAKPCKLCNHQDCAEIERALLNQEVKYQEVAYYIEATSLSVRNHIKNHLTPEVANMIRDDKIDTLMTLETLASQLRMMIFETNKRKEDSKRFPQADFLKTIKELRDTLRLISEIRKEIGTDPNANLGHDLRLFFDVVKVVLSEEGSPELWLKIKKDFEEKKGKEGEDDGVDIG